MATTTAPRDGIPHTPRRDQAAEWTNERANDRTVPPRDSSGTARDNHVNTRPRTERTDQTERSGTESRIRPEQSAKDIHPLVQHLVHDVRTYERVAIVTHKAFDARIALEREQAQHTAQHYDTQAAAIAARGEFARSLSMVHRIPAEALQRFEADVRTRGADTALETLATRPETYGTLRQEHRSGWRRVLPDRGANAPARQAAHDAALNAVTMLRRQGEARVAPLSTATLDHAARAVERYAAELRSLPEKAVLERNIAGTLRHFDPVHHIQAEKLLTHAQAAALNTFRASVREVVLGTEGRER